MIIFMYTIYTMHESCYPKICYETSLKDKYMNIFLLSQKLKVFSIFTHIWPVF